MSKSVSVLNNPYKKLPGSGKGVRDSESRVGDVHSAKMVQK